MSDNSYSYQDDPTEPVRPSSYPSQDNNLVIGNFQNAQKRQEHGPYQYPPPQQGAQGGSTMPASNPNSPSYPYQQPGQAAGNFGSAPTPQRPPRRRRGRLVGC